MNKNEPNPKYKSGEIKEDDLDIGQLFTLIGKGVMGIVNFIADLFKTLF